MSKIKRFLKLPKSIQAKEQQRLVELHDAAVDTKSEGFKLLEAEIQACWDMRNMVAYQGSEGAMGHIVALSLDYLMCQGSPVPASEITFEKIMAIKVDAIRWQETLYGPKGELVRTQKKTGEIPAEEAFKLVLDEKLRDLVNCSERWQYSDSYSWGSTPSSRRDEAARWSKVFEKWYRDEDLKKVLLNELWTSLRTHALGQRVVSLVEHPRQASGFYGNVNFPITPDSGDYNEKNIERFSMPASDDCTLNFQWVRIEDPEDLFDWRMYDWNAQLIGPLGTEPLAYASGLAFAPRSKEEAIPVIQLWVIADSIASFYAPAIEALMESYVDGFLSTPVAVVQRWERWHIAPKGLGAVCLTEAIKLLHKKLGDRADCFIHAVPGQYAMASGVMADSQALKLRLFTAELTVIGELKKIKQGLQKSHPNLNLRWLDPSMEIKPIPMMEVFKDY
jgi:hypothetical protein